MWSQKSYFFSPEPMTLIVITLKITVMIPELINAMIIELRYREEIDLDVNLSGQEDAASTEFSRLDIGKWTSSTASLITRVTAKLFYDSNGKSFGGGGRGGGLSNGSRNGFIGEMEEDGGTFRELKVETASIFAPR